MNTELDTPASGDSRHTTGNTFFVDGGSYIEGAARAPELPEEKPWARARVYSRLPAASETS